MITAKAGIYADPFNKACCKTSIVEVKTVDHTYQVVGNDSMRVLCKKGYLESYEVPSHLWHKEATSISDSINDAIATSRLSLEGMTRVDITDIVNGYDL